MLVARYVAAGRRSTVLLRCTLCNLSKSFTDAPAIITKQSISHISANDISTMSSSEIVNLMFQSTNLQVRLSNTQLKAITSKMAKFDDDMSARSIGNMIYSLRPYDFSEISCLVPLLSARIAATVEVMRAQHVSNVMYGLHGMSSSNPAVCKLVGVLASKFSLCHESFNALEFGNCLYGLRNLRSKQKEVRRLVAVLTEKLESCDEALPCKIVGISLFGLRYMDTYYGEVQNLVTMLAQKIQNSPMNGLDASTISSSLYGLQSCTYWNFPGMTLLAQDLASKIRAADCVLDAGFLAAALTGLQMADMHPPGARSLLGALTAKIPAPTGDGPCSQITARTDGEGTVSTTHVAKALSGLQSMRSVHAEVRVLLVVLTGKLAVSAGPHSPQDICNVMLSLRHKNINFPEVRRCVRIIASWIAASDEILDGAQLLSVLESVRDICQRDLPTPELLELIAAVAPLVTRLPIGFDAQIIKSALSVLNVPLLQTKEGAAFTQSLTAKAKACLTASTDKLDADYLVSVLSGAMHMPANEQHLRSLFNVIVEKCAFSINAWRVSPDRFLGAVRCVAELEYSHAQAREVLLGVAEMGNAIDHVPLKRRDLCDAITQLSLLRGVEREGPGVGKLLVVLLDMWRYSNLRNTELQRSPLVGCLYGLQDLFSVSVTSSKMTSYPAVELARSILDEGMLKEATAHGHSERGPLLSAASTGGTLELVQQLSLMQYKSDAKRRNGIVFNAAEAEIYENVAAVLRYARRRLVPITTRRKSVLRNTQISDDDESLRVMEYRATVNEKLRETVTHSIEKHRNGKCVFVEFDTYVDVFPVFMLLCAVKEEGAGPCSASHVYILDIDGISDSSPTRRHRNHLRDCFLRDKYKGRVSVERVTPQDADDSLGLVEAAVVRILDLCST